jgi:hypothetical protein
MGASSALGAAKVQLLALALRNSVLLTGIGLAAGALGIFASRTLASRLFDTPPAVAPTQTTLYTQAPVFRLSRPRIGRNDNLKAQIGFLMPPTEPTKTSTKNSGIGGSEDWDAGSWP